jgi:ASC-1-like (ASCH) protein
MATYDAPLHLEAFENMEANQKTVYTLPASVEYRFMVSGDRLEFGSFGSITVGMVRRYPSLEELVKAQGWECLVPEAEDATAAIKMVRANEDWDLAAEDEHGVLALRVREARRK